MTSETKFGEQQIKVKNMEFLPDSVLLDELKRRLQNGQIAAEKVRQILDNLK